MTGFAQAKGQINNLAFSVSVKSVNHRFLDLHFRLPSNTDSLEISMRRVLKEKLARGHVDVNLSFEQGGAIPLSLNKTLVSGYVQAFRAAAVEAGIAAEPDLNAVLRLPGALDTNAAPADEELAPAVLPKLEQAVDQLNRAREEEGRAMDRELRDRMESIRKACGGVASFRDAVLRTYSERLQARSDIQEELVRLNSHVEHFLSLLDSQGEVGKKMDFLLQEMNREANTLLSKTSGLAGDAASITEAGLSMKSDIEKAREQVQNIE
jgi:uncharacterized protein YicC (UPF0701 family)